MGAYYNDHDPQVCAWLRELIRRGLIPAGDVDDRSILDVRPADLAGYTACHFFAGIGGWAYALRLAGWPDDRPVWTGSPPCQPFSAAGRGLAADDARHLAPHYAALVAACRPPVLFGEQVASASVFGHAAKAAKRAAARAFGLPAWAWWDDLSLRLEAAHYAVGAGDIPAASVGAPHIRQRCFFGAVRMADADGGNASAEGLQRSRQHGQQPKDGGACGLADADDARPQGRGERGHGADQRASREAGMACGLADSPRDGRRQERAHARGVPTGNRAQGRTAGPSAGGGDHRPGPHHGFWDAADWLHCRDGKLRPVEPGTFPLADGIPARMVRLRAYGNAIVPQVAAEFVGAFMEAALQPPPNPSASPEPPRSRRNTE